MVQRHNTPFSKTHDLTYYYSSVFINGRAVFLTNRLTASLCVYNALWYNAMTVIVSRLLPPNNTKIYIIILLHCYIRIMIVVDFGLNAVRLVAKHADI